jgi:hypothetical protein
MTAEAIMKWQQEWLDMQAQRDEARAERDAAKLQAAEAVVALNNRDRERMQAEHEARAAEAKRDAAIMDADMQAREAGNMEHNARVLMSERDKAVAALALYRAENGCTRGQTTTQWCGEASRLRRAWLRLIQRENHCPATGGGCFAEPCSCLGKMEKLVEENCA